MNYIISRSSNNIKYVIYKKNPNNTFSIFKEIEIKGRADVIDKKTLITEKGAITNISDKDLELLKSNISFKRHLEKGFIAIVSNEKDAKKIKDNGELEKSNSAQLTKEDINNDGDVEVDDNDNLEDFVESVSKKKRKK